MIKPRQGLWGAGVVAGGPEEVLQKQARGGEGRWVGLGGGGMLGWLQVDKKRGTHKINRGRKGCVTLVLMQ